MSEESLRQSLTFCLSAFAELQDDNEMWWNHPGCYFVEETEEASKHIACVYCGGRSTVVMGWAAPVSHGPDCPIADARELLVRLRHGESV